MTPSPSPIAASDAPWSPAEIARQVRFGDVQWEPEGECLIWLEQRSDRGVLVCFDSAASNRRDLTAEISVRAGWGYGGGDFAVAPGCVYYLSGTRLFRQPLDDPAPATIAADLHDPASPTPSPDNSRLLLIQQRRETDHLQLLAADGSEIRTVAGDRNFVMQPAWHPDGERFVWVGWDHPNMPWDGTGLYTATAGGGTVERIAGDPAGSTAIFQPTFSPDGRWLAYVSDEGGWFNLTVRPAAGGDASRSLAEEAEHAPAAWVQGLRSYAWSPDSRTIVLIRSTGGFDQLLRYSVDTGEVAPVPVTGMTTLGQPTVSGSGRIIVVGSSSQNPPAILEVAESGPGPRPLRHSLPPLPRPPSHGPPEAVQWPVGGQRCFGLWYAAGTATGEPPAAVLRVHGGPTSQYRAEFEPDIQFLTSRGLGVLDVNYRGSAGYGRAYRRSLDGRWGESDVADLCAAADFLADTGRADRRRLVAMGGSAGGFTVLLALARHPGLFAAAVCRYAVSDLLPLVEETHRFERHYLDRLVGELPASEALYRSRSPLQLADAIRDPVALFQGADDRVVPRSQTEALVRRLAANGVSHVYRLYPGEGHGWRRTETIADYYKTVAGFLESVLGSEAGATRLSSPP